MHTEHAHFSERMQEMWTEKEKKRFEAENGMPHVHNAHINRRASPAAACRKFILNSMLVQSRWIVLPVIAGRRLFGRARQQFSQNVMSSCGGQAKAGDGGRFLLCDSNVYGVRAPMIQPTVANAVKS